MKELEEVKPKELEKPKADNIQLALLEIVRREDIDPERLEKFLELQIKMEDRQAKGAFSEALAGFQGDCPVIEKSKKVDFGAASGNRVKYDYSPLDEIAHAIRPHLRKWGLAYRFKIQKTETANEMNLITVISHKNGHSEESDYFFTRLHDDKRMNESQKAKSAITYTKRAALENALGIITGGEDNDARTVDLITENQLKETREILAYLEKEEEPFLEYCSRIFKKTVNKLEEMEVNEGAQVINFLKDLKKNYDKQQEEVKNLTEEEANEEAAREHEQELLKESQNGN